MAWKFIDPAFLLWNWHIDLLCEEMEAVARRESTETVFCIPPRSLKSQIMSVAFPAWVWTWHPSAKFLCGSNEMTLATRDAVKSRRLVKSTWYQRRWGPGSAYCSATKLSSGEPHPGVAVVNDQDNKTYYETTAGGHRFACTPASNVTGHGGDYVMVDDPHPAQKAESDAERLGVLRWWFEAIPSRLNEPDRGAKMVVQQRVHTDDLAGNCIKKGYHKVVLPMRFEPDHPDLHPKDPRKVKGEILHKSRLSEAAVERLEKAMGGPNGYAAAGQLQQRPGPRDGGMFKRHWFRFVDVIPPECAKHRVRRWDLAASVPVAGSDPDWTAGVRTSKDALGRIYIEHAIKFRETAAKTDETIKGIAQMDGRSTEIWLPQDPGQAGKAQVEALTRYLAPYIVKIERETGDKATRARGFASMVEGGQVFLLRGGWNDELIEELCGFPNGAHDDYVDAAAGAFNALYGGNTGFLDFMRGLYEQAHS